jgi:hypothetical protein
MLFFEMFGPLIELTGYLFMTVCLLAGLVSPEAWIAFMLLAVGLGILLSISGLMLEEISFHFYPRPRQMLALAAVAVLENLGYRQLSSYWRLVGLIRWMRRTEATWGKMSRSGSWSRKV